MRQLFVCISVLAAVAGYGQQKNISSDLNLAVKQAQGLSVYAVGTSPSLFVKFGGVFRESNYTSDIFDRRINMIYVDGDKLYSNTYIPIVLQQHQTNLAVDAFYNVDKMYALPDKPVNVPRQ
ncbi:hypothetical protein ACX0HA_03085 [Flavobacterium hauense]